MPKIANDVVLLHCPHCGVTDYLTVYTDPENPIAQIVMCNNGPLGCGAMAPLQTWNMRKSPARPAILKLVDKGE